MFEKAYGGSSVWTTENEKIEKFKEFVVKLKEFVAKMESVKMSNNNDMLKRDNYIKSIISILDNSDDYKRDNLFIDDEFQDDYLFKGFREKEVEKYFCKYISETLSNQMEDDEQKEQKLLVEIRDHALAKI